MQSIQQILSCAGMVVLAGCSKGSTPQDSSTNTPKPAVAAATPSHVPEPAPAIPAPAPKVEIEITAAGNSMLFDKTSLVVPAGAEIHLLLKDHKPGNLPHNWVLVKPGTEAAVAAAGLSAGLAGNYVTSGPNVIAFTPLALPGGTSEVTFQAPPPGTYPYICSFPGHYLMMKGTLVVGENPAVAANAAEAPKVASASAQRLFTSRCGVCHGSSGAGDGPGAAALNPKPRAFGDAAWQGSATDEQISKVILLGGVGVGKSPGMPANPDLADNPDLVKELVSIVRGFKKG